NNTLVSCSGMSGVDVIAEISNQCQVCFQYESDSNDLGQCNSEAWHGSNENSGTVCAPIGAWTPTYRDDSDERSGGCRVRWGFDCEAPYGDLIQAVASPGGFNPANNNNNGNNG